MKKTKQKRRNAVAKEGTKILNKQPEKKRGREIGEAK